MVRSTTAAVVLAAGAGSRFAGPDHKLLAALRGLPVVVWAVTAALDAGLAETIVVSGAVDLGPTLADYGLADRVRVVVNPAWAEGQATSLAAGITAVEAAGHDAAVVGLGDQPLVAAEAWRLVATRGLDRPMAVATYEGRRRNPVRLDRVVWPDLPTAGDEGARGLLARRPDLVEEVPCPGESADVDTLEDLTRWSLSNEFEVPVPLDQAWDILTDIERIAPCLPGAQLQEVEGDEYRGIVKVKVGPITAQYKGVARLIEKDDATHRALLQASGRDTRGAGNASADIRAELVGHGDNTHVSLVTDLTITGKVAQFGRGVLADVSAKLLDQFVANLEVTVLAEELAVAGLELELEALTTDDPIEAEVAAEAAEAAFDAAEAAAELVDSTGPDGSPAVADAGVTRRIDSPEPEPVDLLDAAGVPVAKRLVGVAAVITALALIFGLGRRRRRRRRA